jgi:hypothetical protein
MSEAPDRSIWDDIVKAGWGPGYAAGGILTLLRDRIPSGSEREAEATMRWYYRQLVEHASRESSDAQDKTSWTRALAELWEWLTPEEHRRLKA